MQGLLAQLEDIEVWRGYLAEKTAQGHLSRSEQTELERLIDQESFRPVLARLTDPETPFPLPAKKLVNKGHTGKKRVVYLYPRMESWVLKLVAHLMERYDGCFHPSCYSFRKGRTAGMAIRSIRRIPGIDRKYSVKIDIHDYFNSIPARALVRQLEEVITDDPALLALLTELLTQDRCVWRGQVIEEARGAMAGTPVSPFFANLYLRSLDRLFEEKGVPYYRYSDDVIFFVDTQEEADAYLALLEDYITGMGLTLNESKLALTGPGEPWSFLGFCYRGGEVDLAANTVKKMKDKIRRKARALYRWRIEKQASYRSTARVMIRTFDRKFFSREEQDLSWSRWFFPVINTTKGLHEVDRYLVQYLRYLETGRHSKINYRVAYDQLKDMGYRSLVNEYYKYRREPVEAT